MYGISVAILCALHLATELNTTGCTVIRVISETLRAGRIDF